jgi:hyperosmotically inducible protein
MLSRLFTTSVLAGGLCVMAPPAYAVTAPDSTKAFDTAASQTTTQKPTDDDIKDRVEFRLDTNDLVRKYSLHTKVASGVVTLSGDVANAAQKAEAERLARGVAGVVRVQNDIKVDPDEDKSVTDRVKGGMNKTGDAITDAWITTKVKWFLAKDDRLASVTSINVDTKDHVVTLKGDVKSAVEKTRAVELANKADGVTRVVDQLTISK